MNKKRKIKIYLMGDKPSIQFERMVKSKPGLEMDIDVSGAEEQVEIQSMLDERKIEGLRTLLERDRSGKKRAVGFVTNVERVTDGAQEIQFIDEESGLKMGFYYEPDDKEMFGGAPNGFKAGDLILQTYNKNGLSLRKVEVLDGLPLKTKKKLARGFMQTAAKTKDIYD